MSSIMHRTQILLPEPDYRALRELAERERRSMANLIREAVERYLEERRQRAEGSLAAIRGVGSDPSSSGREHDRILYRP